MKCPKCSGPLLCKSPRYDIHETGRIHLIRKEIELGKKLESVPGEETNTIYFCEDCGLSGSSATIFQLVMMKGEGNVEHAIPNGSYDHIS